MVTYPDFSMIGMTIFFILLSIVGVYVSCIFTTHAETFSVRMIGYAAFTASLVFILLWAKLLGSLVGFLLF